jgi:hypothetical protein
VRDDLQLKVMATIIAKRIRYFPIFIFITRYLQ